MRQTQKAEIGNATTTQSIVEAVAELDGADPLELTPPLCEVVDPEALDSLFAHDTATGKVVFSYNNCEVSVFSDGFVSVEKRGK